MIEYTWRELTRLKLHCSGYTVINTTEESKVNTNNSKKDYTVSSQNKTYPIKDRLKSYCSGASLFCQGVNPVNTLNSYYLRG